MTNPAQPDGTHLPPPPASSSFDHQRTVVVGSGRVIWADREVMVDGQRVPPGWVLPGGRRTTDRAEAIYIAGLIHNLATRSYP